MLFDDVSDAVRAMAPPDLGTLGATHHRWGIKVWFGAAKAPKEHYEAQVIDPQSAPGASVLAIEVGFHSEHPKEADNESVISDVMKHQREWRKSLGKEPAVGPFLGRAQHWRRISEVWLDPNLEDPELALELAARLTDYATALEPCRHGRLARS